MHVFGSWQLAISPYVYRFAISYPPPIGLLLEFVKFSKISLQVWDDDMPNLHFTKHVSRKYFAFNHYSSTLFSKKSHVKGSKVFESHTSLLLWFSHLFLDYTVNFSLFLLLFLLESYHHLFYFIIKGAGEFETTHRID